VFGALIAEIRRVNTLKQTFSRAEQDRRNGQMHLIYKSCTKILPDSGNPAAEPDILTVRSVSSSFKCGVDAIGDKVEGSASAHGDRCTWVVGEDEDGSVVRRVVAPPALPGVVGPRSADRAKHVATDDPCADVVEATRREVIVNPRRAAIIAKHLLKGTCGECPFVQRDPADAKWIVEILVGTGTVAIEGYREAVDAKLGHLCSFSAPIRLHLASGITIIKPSAYGNWFSIRWRDYDRAWRPSIGLSRQPHAGDARRRWSLILIRDVMFGNRRRYRELMNFSEEGIASNILADRLTRLVDAGNELITAS